MCYAATHVVDAVTRARRMLNTNITSVFIERNSNNTPREPTNLYSGNLCTVRLQTGIRNCDIYYVKNCAAIRLQNRPCVLCACVRPQVEATPQLARQERSDRQHRPISSTSVFHVRYVEESVHLNYDSVAISAHISDKSTPSQPCYVTQERHGHSADN